MKKLYRILVALLITASTFAQAPEKMSYQAVVRDATNTVVTNQSVGMQISILQTTITGISVYTETQTATTNINGLVSLEIGAGTTSDDFSTIDWSAGPYFIKTETFPTGGVSYSITGTSQIMSVPFALYVKTAGSSETNATNIDNNTIAIALNTSKVGYTEALVSANTDVAANTSKVGYTDALVSANTDVAANTSKVGYTDALVSANTDVAANTAKVGYTDALVSVNTEVSANTFKVGYTDALVSANPDVVANTLKVGYTDALVSANPDVVANTLKVGYTDALISANTLKVGYTDALASANPDVVANTLKVGYTDALVSANPDVVANTLKVGYTSALVSTNPDVLANTAKVGYTDALVSANPDVVANTAKVGYTDALVSANPDVVANTAKVGYTQPVYTVNTFYAALGGYVIEINADDTHGLVAAMQDQGTSTWYQVNDLLSNADNHDAHGAKFKDWRLPTKRELNLMYAQRASIGDFTTYYYWSSTEYDANYAWLQFFNNGNQNYSNKDYTSFVRAVRAF